MPGEFPYDVFLSHSAKDKPVVRDVAERLKKDGLRVWFDEWEIRPGDSIERTQSKTAKIEEGLERSRVLVLCRSANAFGSDWAQLESGTFRFRDLLNNERRFISILRGGQSVALSDETAIYRLNRARNDIRNGSQQCKAPTSAMGDILRLFEATQEQLNRLSPEVEILPHAQASSDLFSFSAALPHSSEAEKAILTCILLSPRECAAACVEHRLSEKDFYFPAHRAIFTGLIELWNANKPIDSVTLIQFLQSRGLLEEVGGASFITDLPSLLSTTANLLSYIDIVRDKSLRRQVMLACAECARRCEDENASVDSLEMPLHTSLSLVAGLESGITTPSIKQHVLTAIGDIQRLYDRRGSISGLSSGFGWLDAFTDGFHPGDLILVTGTSSRGPSAFVLNIVERLLLQLSLRIAVFSLKTTSEQLVQRLLCLNADIAIKRVRDGFLEERDFPALMNAAAKLAASHCYIDDSACPTLLQFRGRAQRMRSQHAVDMIFIDRVDLLRSGLSEAGRLAVDLGGILPELKSLARELGVPILVSSQFDFPIGTSGARRVERLPIIEQAVDLVAVLLHSSDETSAEMLVSKPREDLAINVPLVIDKETGRVNQKSDGIDEARTTVHVEDGENEQLQMSAKKAAERQGLLDQYHALLDRRMLGNLNPEESASLDHISEELDRLDESDSDIAAKITRITSKDQEANRVLGEIREYLEAFLNQS